MTELALVIYLSKAVLALQIEDLLRFDFSKTDQNPNLHSNAGSGRVL